MVLLLAATAAAALLVAALWSLPVQVHGTAVDVNGRPLPQVEASLLSGSHVLAQAPGLPNGDFQLGGGHLVPQGLTGYQVTLSSEGFVPARMVGARTVLHRLPVLQGQVVNSAGSGLGGALLTLVSPGASQPITLFTDLQGRFSSDGELRPAIHWLTVTRPGYEPATQAIEVALDRVTAMNPVLQRQVGTVTVGSKPAGQQVLVDGQPRTGCLTPCTVSLETGAHSVDVASALYVSARQNLMVNAGDVLTTVVDIQRKTGQLTVNAPAGRELTIDGQPVPGGDWTGPLPTGTHTVVARAAGAWPLLRVVTVDWKQSVALHMDPVATDPAGFTRGLNAYLDSLGGQYSVFLSDLATGQEMGLNQDLPMATASVIKLPLALYVLQQVEGGAIGIEDPVELQAGDFMGGTGTLQGTAHPGDRYSVRDLLSLLIQQSDNTAWQALDRVLGTSAVDAYAAQVGAADCHQVEEQCTAAQVGRLLAQLNQGMLLNADHTHFLLQLLETSVFNDRINYYLPGVAVAHKVGMIGSVINDAGLVLVPGHGFALAVFSAGGDPQVEVQAIRDIARAAASYYAR
ncbi:MAG: hypothetical protein NVSMB17_10170 [Candidatus Dormibacteria bacterium]